MTPRSSRQSSKSPSLLILFLPVTFLLGLGAGWLFWGRIPASVATATPEVRRMDVSEDNNPAIGPENAPVTIIEFSDYQCPYCKVWHDQVYDRLLANYPGQIRFVYRDFPLPGHPEALPSAEAANCAGEQNAYWTFQDGIFSRQAELGRAAYEQIAQDLGLNQDAFRLCLDGNRYKAEVTADYQYATDLGVNSTPTFFINGIQVIGAQPYEIFRQIIDQELAGGSQ